MMSTDILHGDLDEGGDKRAISRTASRQGKTLTGRLITGKGGLGFTALLQIPH